MHSVYFMGIDIGTYESKGVLIDEAARVVAYCARPHALETPRPGYAEHDAESAWWGDLCALSKQLIADSGVSPAEIQSLGVSTIGPCCLPVDREIRPLRKAILYGIDVRAARQIDALNGRLGAENIFARYGTPLTSQSAGAKILWIQENEPEIYAKTYKFVTGGSYLVAKLTGTFAIDRYTAAAFVPLYNVAAEDWEADLHGICDRKQLADLYWSDEIAGTITPEAALETGLMPGTRVTAGTADAGAEAFSVGVLRPGDMMVMFGSSIFIIHVVGEPRSDPRLWSGPYLFKGTYCLTAGMSCAGTLTRWFKDALAPELAARAEAEGLNAYAELAKLCADIPAGSDGLIVLPYFSGERTPINDPDAKGVIFGLNLLHTRAHLYRACLEGVGYGINQHFEIFDAMGLPPRRVTAVGGGTKNAVWLQAVADICGRPYHLPEVEAGAAYGDALMAALATGHFKDVDAVRSLLKMRAVAEPDSETHRAYQPFAGRYARLYEATKGLMHEG